MKWVVRKDVPGVQQFLFSDFLLALLSDSHLSPSPRVHLARECSSAQGFVCGIPA